MKMRVISLTGFLGRPENIHRGSVNLTLHKVYDVQGGILTDDKGIRQYLQPRNAARGEWQLFDRAYSSEGHAIFKSE